MLNTSHTTQGASLYLITVEHQHLASKQPPHGFDRLRLARASGPIGVPPKPHLHGLGQSQVALISQWSVHQLSRIPLRDRRGRMEKKVSDKERKKVTETQRWPDRGKDMGSEGRLEG